MEIVADPFVENSEKEAKPVRVESGRAARGIGIGARGDKRLDFEEKGAGSFEAGNNRRAGKLFHPLFEKGLRRIGHFGKACLFHLEDRDLVGGPKPVFNGAKETKSVLPVALKIEDGVDEVLENARAS